MATEGISAIGTVLSFNGNTLGEVESFSGSGITVNIHEVLTTDSTDNYADAIGGALNSGEVTFGMIADLTSGGNFELLKDDAEARTKGTLLITFPNTAYITGDAIISNLGDPEFGEADSVMRFNVTLKRVKKQTYTPV
jgi:hypothetical protein